MGTALLVIGLTLISNPGSVAALGDALSPVALARIWRTQPPTDNPPPYTVILRTSQSSATGAHVPITETTFAVRSDGAYAQRTLLRDAPAPGPRQCQRLIVFASGERIETDDVNQLRSTTFNNARGAGHLLRDPKSNCMNSRAGAPAVAGQRALGEDVINGYRVVMIKAAGTVYSFARDLGCAPLQVRGAVVDERASSIEPGEPNPEFFTVPSTFREVPPSELYRLPNGSKAAQDWNSYYYAHRPK